MTSTSVRMMGSDRVATTVLMNPYQFLPKRVSKRGSSMDLTTASILFRSLVKLDAISILRSSGIFFHNLVAEHNSMVRNSISSFCFLIVSLPMNTSVYKAVGNGPFSESGHIPAATFIYQSHLNLADGQ